MSEIKPNNSVPRKDGKYIVLGNEKYMMDANGFSVIDADGKATNFIDADGHISIGKINTKR
ncbi:hypothetical protein EFT87_04085 [Schleiferilactobacillus harbinensis]|uniref:hypothetical protein n=1 Tax=Schleiferilactobacillus harbinensis TaxID=304207 RepID=UPI0021A8733C|nr:hypothetical protein [Schleiferilactobacillus harbinensis]MCT2907839.1 hypothetical protein [Schleiferilactobacillus harbinensis]